MAYVKNFNNYPIYLYSQGNKRHIPAHETVLIPDSFLGSLPENVSIVDPNEQVSYLTEIDPFVDSEIREKTIDTTNLLNEYKNENQPRKRGRRKKVGK